ncbi:MAG: hypothetical protein ACYTG0_09190 [Planctomycetota bacterium]
METSLHRDLKTMYAGQEARFEVRLGGYRIDVVSDDVLVEVQHGSLAAIRDKVAALLRNHRVLVVKPIVASKRLVKLRAKGGPVTGRRKSPKRGQILDLFDDLVYFTRVFPHQRLTLEVVMVDVEEWRYPGHGRRRRWRRNDFQMEDQRLLAVREVYPLRTAADVARLIACPPPEPFDTRDLAQSLGIDRWVAQRIAYCLRKIGAVREIGKKGNALLYEFPPSEGIHPAKRGRKKLNRAG